MNDDLQEIAGLITTAREYCVAVPEGDPRRPSASAVADACQDLEALLDALQQLPEDRRALWVARLAEGAQRMGRLLSTMEAIEQSERANRAAEGRLTALNVVV